MVVQNSCQFYHIKRPTTSYQDNFFYMQLPRGCNFLKVVDNYKNHVLLNKGKNEALKC